MKKDNFLRCIAIFCIAILALLSAPEVKAQGDILDESSGSQLESCDPGTYEINFDFNTSDSDTTVIFTNTSCYVKLVPGIGAQYKFCTAHDEIGECLADLSSGVFDITFEDNVGAVGVHKISFIIYTPTTTAITVRSFPDDIVLSYTTFSSPPHRLYICEDASNEFTRFEITCASNTGIDTDGELFALDELFIIYDTDGDGTFDDEDGCPNDPNKTEPGICGCGNVDDLTDTDSDGTPDCNDGCPNDPNKIAEGDCGCGVADTDTDGDGTPDCNDGCPNDPNKIAAGDCGCGVADTDTDNDGTPDCVDDCPNDPNKTEPGICGCGNAEDTTDTDSDGTPDCVDDDDDDDGVPDTSDAFPLDSSESVDTDGDGVGNNADTDNDNDGVLDLSDWDPLDPQICEDADCDGCDDCSQNVVTISTTNDPPWTVYTPDPDNDGTDTDSDGRCDAGDPGGVPDIVCVIDVSGSMSWDFNNNHYCNDIEKKITHARSALTAFVNLLWSNADDVNFGIAHFPDPPQNYCTPKEYQSINLLDDTYRNSLINTHIPALFTGGSTPLLGGIYKAIEMLNSSVNKKVIVLLTDGQHNCPSSINNSLTTACINALYENRIKLYTIGFGAENFVPNDLLATLADGTCGNHYNIATEFTKLPLEVYDSDFPGDWTASTALNAAYANILIEGLELETPIDPLGIINQGETKEFEIPVSVYDSRVCFFVSWETPQINNLRVRLFKPNDGTELLLGQPGITDIRQNTHTIITISEEILNQEGMVGTWRLEISDSNMSKATEHYQYTVISTSKNLKLNTWFDKNVYYTGDVMKIYLELLSKDGRLTDMDNVYVKGTKPGEGLGSWLVSKKVTPKLMGKIRREQLDELIKWKMEQPQYKKLSIAEKEPFLKAQKKSFIEKLDPVYLRSQVLMKKRNIKYPRRAVINGLTFNDEGADGDKVAGDGLFTAMHSPLTTEGSYKFFVSVIDSSKGKNIQRESQLQTYVNVKYELDGIIRFATIADTVIKGRKVYNVPLKLKDKFGNIPGPLALIHMYLQVDKGELIGDIQANPIGTFTQMVSIPENIKLKDVTITMIVDDRIGEQKLKSPVPRWIYKIFYRCYLRHFENFYKKEKID